MTTPRDNLLKTLRCEDAEWVPVCLGLTPNEHPTREIPPALAEVFDPNNVTWGDFDRNSILLHRLGDYLGAEDYMVPVAPPVHLESQTCSSAWQRLDDRQSVAILSTPLGDLRQVTTTPEGAPSLVTERYVKTAEDAVRLTAYFASLDVVPSPGVREGIRACRERVGDRGILFCRSEGTPLGMCYRVYSDLPDLVYLLADEPKVVDDLFTCMEGKYVQLYERMLEEAPDIDAFLGMDDTSTNLISPAMFGRFNVELTNRRADLCHRRGKLYLHHSCGLIRDLLPIYRKTRMDGVDAFTAPPLGNVGYAEGRRLLGPSCSLRCGLGGGLNAFDEAAVDRHVRARFADARAAGHVAFAIGGAHLTFPALAALFRKAEAQKHVL
jgi:hypothetical protein